MPTPLATYRLQMHAGFTIPDALRVTPYLHALGISHPYTSSLLAARPGSTHGYDVADHGKLNPEIGTDADFAAWAAARRDRGMGLVLDTVPNHMVVGQHNAWWMDVLEHGPASPFADYFDIAWNDHPRERLHGKVLLPVLGEPYAKVLESGEFKPVLDGGAMFLELYGNRLPVGPRTYAPVLAAALDTARAALGAEDPGVLELQSILNAVKNMPQRDDPDPERRAERRVETGVIKRRLREQAERFPAVAEHVRAAVAVLAGTPGDAASFAALDQLLESQAYRPCFWRVASDEINYRRFFDINDLAALSTEREEVFRAVHKKLFDWIAAGDADGLRIDHPDGLFDPKQYLDRLQGWYAEVVAQNLSPGPSPMKGGEQEGDSGSPARDDLIPLAPPSFSGKGAGGLGSDRLYVVVEKILGHGERLQAEWATDGTTGYEFLNAVNGLFVDPKQEAAVTDVYQRFAGVGTPYDETVYRCKFQILQTSLASELHMLAHQLDRLAQADRWSRDFTLNGLRHALREVIACFPVYRSYVDGGVRETDVIHIARACRKARRRNPELGDPVFNFIRDTLLLRDPPSGPASDDYRAAQRRFAGKFQQVTSPVMAKGLEDTAFYVFNRLTSLNEVGGEPGRFGWPPEKVHAFLKERAEKHPRALNPLSTHDTKRGEDVRARINVLAEIPGEWNRRLAHWAHLNRRHKPDIDAEDGTVAPDGNEEYLLYQTLVGAWPVPGSPDDDPAAFTARIQAYMTKAMREAKVHTSWINPDKEYDDAVSAFIANILDPRKSAEFLADLREFVARVGHFGMLNSLAQTLIRCTAPGVPDTYQGTELWDFSLVDPDNRRPVDYDARTHALSDLDARAAADPRGLANELAADMADGRVKLFVVSRALRARHDHPDLFAGGYEPLTATGPKADHLFAYLRTAGSKAALVAAPRLVVGLCGSADRPDWGDTAVRLPDGFAGRTWANVFTNERATPGASFAASAALADFPVGLWVAE